MKTRSRQLIAITAACLSAPTNAQPPDQGYQSSNGGPAMLRVAQRAADDGQSAQESGSANARSPSERRRTRGAMEEVIVTATKRSENIQDVPISITAISADEIDRRGLVDSEDYLRGVPGVSQLGSYKTQAIIIRGMETQTINQNAGAGPTTATYFGETPTSSTAGLNGGSAIDVILVDIERVEVLRGPQGTSFGNSALGGAVRTIPVSPRLDEFEGRVSAGYSATSGTGGDNYDFYGIANIPLVRDKLGVRATAYRYQDSGFYRNRAASDAAFQQRSVTPYGVQEFAKDQEDVGAYNVFGGRVSAMFQPIDDLRVSIMYLNQKNETDGWMAEGPRNSKYEQTVLQVAPEHVIRGKREGVSDAEIELMNALIQYDLGWADVLGTYSYTDSSSRYATPWGSQMNIAVPVSFDIDSNHHREKVGEARISTKLNGAWNFLLGLYSENVEDGNAQDYKWYGATGTNLFDPTGFYDPGRRHLGTRADGRDLKQIAAFGEVSWKFDEHWTLTGGARTYEYDRTHVLNADGAFYGVNGIHQFETTSVSNTNYRADVAFEPRDNLLFYAGWSEGFRIGRAQQGLPEVCDGNRDGIADVVGIPLSDTTFVDPDSVDNYEVGGKVSLMDRRLMIDSAVFRMDWSDIPVNIDGGGGTCPFTFAANVGKARSDGIELQAGFQVTESIRLDAGGSYTHARLMEDVPTLNAVEGSRLPGSPKVIGNLGVQHDFDIGQYTASLRVDSIYIGPFYGNLQETPNTKAGDYIKVDVSARMQLDRLSFDLFVRNLTNEDAFSLKDSAGYQGYRLRPRTVGLRLGYSF